MSLADVAEQVAARKLPPVAAWQPTQLADSLMRIAADGTWYHDGGVIGRAAMVRAFSTLLRREGDVFFLVTPFEKQSIVVEDAPFIAVDVALREGTDGAATLVFRLNTDDFVIADEAHPIVARGDAEVPALYVVVRDGLEARLNRSTYAQLIDIAFTQSDDPEQPAVSSASTRFSLVP